MGHGPTYKVFVIYIYFWFLVLLVGALSYGSTAQTLAPSSQDDSVCIFWLHFWIMEKRHPSLFKVFGLNLFPNFLNDSRIYSLTDSCAAFYFQTEFFEFSPVALQLLPHATEQQLLSLLYSSADISSVFVSISSRWPHIRCLTPQLRPLLHSQADISASEGKCQTKSHVQITFHDLLTYLQCLLRQFSAWTCTLTVSKWSHFIYCFLSILSTFTAQRPWWEMAELISVVHEG